MDGGTGEDPTRDVHRTSGTLRLSMILLMHKLVPGRASGAWSWWNGHLQTPGRARCWVRPWHKNSRPLPYFFLSL